MIIQGPLLAALTAGVEKSILETGVSEEFYEDGQVKLLVESVDGVKYGKFEEYFPDGKHMLPCFW